MQKMSQSQNHKRWVLPSQVKLRVGQRKILESVESYLPQKRLLAELPTGYGKTLSICIGYAKLRSIGVCNRMLIVVPSIEQFNSYIDEIEKDFSKIEAKITGAAACLSNFAVKMHRTNESEVFVVTVQALVFDLARKDSDEGSTIYSLIKTGDWLLAADEFHHYGGEDSNGNDKKWKAALKELYSSPRIKFTLGLSATPTRTDRQNLFIEGDIDIRVTLKEAVEEDAIRRVSVRVQDHFVDVSFEGDEAPERLTLVDYQQRLKELEPKVQIQEAEFRRKVRLHTKYISKIISDALDIWRNKENENRGQHRIIVFAMTCEHAKTIASTINELEGERLADWVASGKDYGRPEKTNADIIKLFKKGEIKALVQVAKAAEGFNCIEASTLVFLNTIGESVLLQQMIGRGLRRNYGIAACSPGVVCKSDMLDILISDDHPGKDFMLTMNEQIGVEDDQENKGKGKGKGEQLQLFSIYDFYIVNSEFKNEGLYFPLGGGNSISLENAVLKARDLPELENATDEDIQGHLKKLFGMEPQPQSTMEKIATAKRDIEGAVKTLVGNVIRIRAADGISIPKTLAADTIRAVHSKWKREKEMSHDDMTFSELVEKYNWVKEINEEMKESKKVPKWLMI